MVSAQRSVSKKQPSAGLALALELGSGREGTWQFGCTRCAHMMVDANDDFYAAMERLTIEERPVSAGNKLPRLMVVIGAALCAGIGLG